MGDANSIKDAIVHAIGVFSAALGFGFLMLRIGYWIADLKYKMAASKLQKSIDRSIFTPNYTKSELSDAFRSYVFQDCGQADPSHESDFRHVADIREPVFDALDRFLEHSERRRHFLILADSGMGKTSLCINYYNYRVQKYKKDSQFCAIISLSRFGTEKLISNIKNKSDTTLILDALDEDSLAQSDPQNRISNILQASADFKAVIITCRSQFFRDAHAIPKDTGVSVVSPRKGGDARNYTLYHLYLMPFSEAQIQTYLRKQFPIWNIRNLKKRRLAVELIERVPELSGRPMLLELVPDLIREKAASRELYDLYTYMIDCWLDREKSWIEPDVLRAVSVELAIEIHTQSISGGGDRIDRNRLEQIAQRINVDPQDWEKLSTRSLLNRDNDGLLKFAHRSVMEYFFILAAISGDDRCFDIRWTDVMRDLLVSWGYTDDGLSRIADAKRLLTRDLSHTSLVPLSDPPAAPGFVTLSDLSLAASRRSSRSGARRIVNRHWRRDSVRIEDGTTGLLIRDVECDLEWLLSYSGGKLDSDIRDVFQLPIAKQLQILDGSIYRAPSYEELVTLIEALDVTNMTDRLALNELYLIGDTCGERSHLVAEIFLGTSTHNDLYCYDSSRQLLGTDFKISLFEISIYRKVEELSTVKVLPLSVRNLPDGVA